MDEREKVRFVAKHSDAILDLVDNRDEYTRSDLQGVAMAIVMVIMHELKERE